MTPIFFSSSSNNYSLYPSEDHLNNHQFLITPNSQPSSSSSTSLPTTHLFLNSSSNHQSGIFNPQLQHQHQHHEGDNYGSQLAYNDHRIENCNAKGVELSTWNKSGINSSMNNDLNQVKWMSSKMRVMLKMKKPDHLNPNTTTYNSTTREVLKKLINEDHKLPTTPMDQETENSSNTTSSNSNNNIPIRVCSDCNTTKTPLWRSGPRGPKSLCNACGIRQRKARRAMAAAENSNSNIFMDQSIIAPLKVTKTQHKDHKKTRKLKGHVTKYKKRQYSKHITTTSITPPPPPPPPPPPQSPSLSPSPSPSPSSSPPSSSPARRNCVEEFLVSLSKNLTFYHVFPQDEKEAAILLMALSCGYAHET